MAILVSSVLGEVDTKENRDTLHHIVVYTVILIRDG